MILCIVCIYSLALWNGVTHKNTLDVSASCMMDFVKPCILVVSVDDAAQGTVVLSSTP